MAFQPKQPWSPQKQSGQMDNSQPCSDFELQILRDELKTTTKGIYTFGAVAVIIALILPFLGSSKTHGRPMIEFMSYREAALFIILVLGLIFFWYYFTTIPNIKRDLGEKIKLVLKTTIAKKEALVYKRIKGAYILLNSPAGTIKRVAVTPLEFSLFREKDDVIVEYFKNSKKIIKVTNLRIEKDKALTGA